MDQTDGNDAVPSFAVLAFAAAASPEHPSCVAYAARPTGAGGPPTATPPGARTGELPPVGGRGARGLHPARLGGRPLRPGAADTPALGHPRRQPVRGAV